MRRARPAERTLAGGGDREQPRVVEVTPDEHDPDRQAVGRRERKRERGMTGHVRRVGVREVRPPAQHPVGEGRFGRQLVRAPRRRRQKQDIDVRRARGRTRRAATAAGSAPSRRALRHSVIASQRPAIERDLHLRRELLGVLAQARGHGRREVLPVAAGPRVAVPPDSPSGCVIPSTKPMNAMPPAWRCSGSETSTGSAPSSRSRSTVSSHRVRRRRLDADLIGESFGDDAEANARETSPARPPRPRRSPPSVPRDWRGSSSCPCRRSPAAAPPGRSPSGPIGPQWSKVWSIPATPT